MKNSIFILVAAVVAVFTQMPAQTFAQAPQMMSYQSVLRNASSELITNSTVGMRIQILQDSEFGSAVYVETHTPQTNANGLVSLEIGSGTVITGVFANIDWSAGPYFIKTETDPTGGTSYSITGTSQLLSVPYALHAKTTESVSGIITYSVGDFALGGIVFWVNETGQHGLVCAKEDQSSGIKWRAGSINYATMARGDGPYAGRMNTSIIVSVHSAKNDFDGHAALVCGNYLGGGFGDWYLPSKEELNLMYQNKETIDAVATSNSGSSFAANDYWSSTESGGATAWIQGFIDGLQVNYNKSNAYYVRAVRAF